MMSFIGFPFGARGAAGSRTVPNSPSRGAGIRWKPAACRDRASPQIDTADNELQPLSSTERAAISRNNAGLKNRQVVLATAPVISFAHASDSVAYGSTNHSGVALSRKKGKSEAMKSVATA